MARETISIASGMNVFCMVVFFVIVIVIAVYYCTLLYRPPAEDGNGSNLAFCCVGVGCLCWLACALRRKICSWILCRDLRSSPTKACSVYGCGQVSSIQDHKTSIHPNAR